MQAFVHAVADRGQLARINIALIFFAAAQVVLSILLVRLGGAIGVVFSIYLFLTLSYAHVHNYSIVGLLALGEYPCLTTQE